MDAQEWQQGAVKRLASVYEGIATATNRNADLITHVSKALRESAVAINTGRAKSTGTWSRTWSLASVPSAPRPVVPSPVPAPDISSPRIRGPPRRTPNINDDNPHTADKYTTSLERDCTLPPLTPFSPMRSLSRSMPLTPPETPVKIKIDKPYLHSLAEILTPVFPLLDEQDHGKPVKSNTRSSPRKRSRSPPCGTAESSFIRSPSKRKSKAIISSDSPLPITANPPATTSIEVHTRQDQDPKAQKKLPNPAPRVPLIRLRDYDNSTARSREVSLSSVASSYIVPTVSQGYKAEPEACILESDAEASASQADIATYLTPIRATALKHLEEDTSTIVDALRSFINSLHELSADLSTLRKNSDNRDESDSENQNHQPSRTAIASQPPVNRLSSTARSELQNIKEIIAALATPRIEMLKLAKAGPSTNLLRKADIDIWPRGGADKAKILYCLLGKNLGKKDEEVKRLLVAVVEERANEEFLARIGEWEGGVKAMEVGFGELFSY
ncbi:hypothetical protein BDV97DRAFT_396137 [Delphinella strobiligena]|nr:hypothetical protein BDV97DRAFT_396137 [Delphinella strobiligena]